MFLLFFFFLPEWFNDPGTHVCMMEGGGGWEQVEDHCNFTGFMTDMVHLFNRYLWLLFLLKNILLLAVIGFWKVRVGWASRFSSGFGSTWGKLANVQSKGWRPKTRVCLQELDSWRHREITVTCWAVVVFVALVIVSVLHVQQHKGAIGPTTLFLLYHI